jgi:hypothetical protein
MNSYGLSLLEIKHLIERALLPDRCICNIQDGILTLSLTSEADAEQSIQITGVKVEGLNNSRAIAHLVGEARYMLVRQNTGAKNLADKIPGSLRSAR